jgi:hypothetical protein
MVASIRTRSCVVGTSVRSLDGGGECLGRTRIRNCHSKAWGDSDSEKFAHFSLYDAQIHVEAETCASAVLPSLPQHVS